MTPLVLIPGMMCDARLFGPQIDRFSADRPLFLATITQHSTMSALAASILMTAPPSFALAGLSMGGIVAMEILAQATERVERIALLDTNPLAEVDEVKARRLPQMEKVASGGLEDVMRVEMKPNYLASGPGRSATLQLCMDMALRLGSKVFMNQSKALMSRPDYSDTLSSAEIPALVLCGREDQLCPVSRHEMMSELITDSELKIIDDAGHMPTVEQPEATNAALAKWLEA